MRFSYLGFRTILVLACSLSALTGCVTTPAQRLPQQDVVPLPKLETARTRADREEIAAWYEREAESAGLQGAVHLRMRDAYASPDTGDGNSASIEHCQNLLLSQRLAAENNLALAGLHRRLAEEVAE